MCFICFIVTEMVIKVRVLFYGVLFRYDKRSTSLLRPCGVTMSQGQRPPGLSGPLRPNTHTSLGLVRYRLRENMYSLKRT